MPIKNESSHTSTDFGRNTFDGVALIVFFPKYAEIGLPYGKKR
jgi:hypothetical protein